VSAALFSVPEAALRPIDQPLLELLIGGAATQRADDPCAVAKSDRASRSFLCNQL